MLFVPRCTHSFLLGLTVLSCSTKAALYQVVEIVSPTDAEQSYGIALEKEDGTADCFSTYCSDSTYKTAGETLNGTLGLSYKEEVSFSIDNQFYYLDYDDIYDYCDAELGYSTCEYWAYLHWYGNTDNGFGGLQNEREAYYQASYETNATSFYNDSTLAFVPDQGSNPPSESEYAYFYVNNTEDKVVTAIDGNQNVIGNTSSGYYSYGSYYVRLYRNRGYYFDGSTEVVLEPEADSSLTFADSSGEQNVISQMGTTMAFDSFSYADQTYVVGSAAVATFYYDDDDKDYDSDYTDDSDEEDVTNCVDYEEPALYPECQNFGFATRAFIWNISDPNTDANRFSVADWETDTDDDYYEYNDDEASAQASIRAATIASTGTYASLPLLVGYNTVIDDYDNFLMQAALFVPINPTSFSVAENAWSTVFIEEATVEVDDDYIHSNSVATDINENLLIIGHAKRDGDYPSGGVTDNRMFIASASDETPTASFFNDHDEDIFFSSAGGNANSINNYNEIVGQVDAETHSEVSGKQRDHRAFIYPYNGTGSDTTRRARFNNQAWWLDDLTHGGDYSASNNHFRIIDASDINDAGVIIATATQCFADESSENSIEYDSTEHWAYCNNGAGDERITAVQLIPILGADSTDISEREEENTTTSRSGGSLHYLLILALCLLFLQRRVCHYRIDSFSFDS